MSRGSAGPAFSEESEALLWPKTGPALESWPPGAKEGQLRAAQARRHEYGGWLAERLAVAEAPRYCTDVGCCAVLMALIFAACASAGFSLGLGDPGWLASEVDFHARLCGVAPTLESKPFVYWPKPGNLGTRVCVDKCPNSEDVVNSKAVGLPTSGTLLRAYSDQGRRFELSQSLWVEQVPVYLTNAAFGRFCLPPPNYTLLVDPSSLPAGALGSKSDAPAIANAQDAMLTPLARGHGAVLPQIRRFMGDVRLTLRTELAVATVLAAFLLGGVSAGLLRFCPCCVATLGALCCWALALVVSVRLLAAGRAAATDFRVLVVAGFQPALAKCAGAALMAASVAAGVGAILFRGTITRAAKVAGLTLGLLGSTGGQLRPLWGVPVLVAVPQLLGLVALVKLLPWGAALASVRWPREEAVAADGSNQSAVVWPGAGHNASDFVGEEGLDPGGPQIFGFHRDLVFVDGWSASVMLLWIFAARVWLLLIDSLARIAITYVVSAWYFTAPVRPGGPRKTPRGLLGQGIAVALRYHLGTAAARAFLYALVPVPARLARTLAVLATACAAPWSGARAELLEGQSSDEEGGSCCREGGCGKGARSLMVRLGPAALADVSVRGMTRREAAANAADVVSCSLPALQCLVGTPVLLGLPISASIALAAWPVGMTLVSVETARVGAALALVAFAYVAASSWALMYETVSDSFLFCLALDDAAHRAFASRPPEDATEDAEIQLPVYPAVVTDASFALWSSTYTPTALREMLFQISLEMKDDGGGGGGEFDAPQQPLPRLEDSESATAGGGTAQDLDGAEAEGDEEAAGPAE